MTVPYAIGAPDGQWSGLAKLTEECGELLQVLGKLVAYPAGDWHPDDDGRPLRDRLEVEVSDVIAASLFFAEVNGIPDDVLAGRVDAKLARLRHCHKEARS